MEASEQKNVLHQQSALVAEISNNLEEESCQVVGDTRLSQPLKI